MTIPSGNAVRDQVERDEVALQGTGVGQHHESTGAGIDVAAGGDDDLGKPVGVDVADRGAAFDPRGAGVEDEDERAVAAVGMDHAVPATHDDVVRLTVTVDVADGDRGLADAAAGERDRKPRHIGLRDRHAAPSARAATSGSAERRQFTRFTVAWQGGARSRRRSRRRSLTRRACQTTSRLRPTR